MQSILSDLRTLGTYVDQFGWVFYYLAWVWCVGAALYYYTLVVKNLVLDCLSTASVLDCPWLAPDFAGDSARSETFRNFLIYVGGAGALLVAFALQVLASNVKSVRVMLDPAEFSGADSWLVGVTLFAAALHAILLHERKGAATNNEVDRAFELDSAMWVVVVLALGSHATSLLGLFVEPVRQIVQFLASLGTALTATAVLYLRWKWHREDKEDAKRRALPAPKPNPTPKKQSVPVRASGKFNYWSPANADKIHIVVTANGGIKVTDKDGKDLR